MRNPDPTEPFAPRGSFTLGEQIIRRLLIPLLTATFLFSLFALYLSIAADTVTADRTYRKETLSPILLETGILNALPADTESVSPGSAGILPESIATLLAPPATGLPLFFCTWPSQISFR